MYIHVLYCVTSMAARKKQKQLKINLLAQEEFATSVLGRILSWALSTFRVIVIAVEMIVVVAFLSRFWLDARITDLNDELKQKQAIVASQATFEKRFRSAQSRLEILFEVTKEPKKTRSTYRDCFLFTPRHHHDMVFWRQHWE